MEDHLHNKGRLEQEWVALCAYEAEPCATTIAFQVRIQRRATNVTNIVQLVIFTKQSD
jgi:hypothetical protein